MAKHFPIHFLGQTSLERVPHLTLDRELSCRNPLHLVTGIHAGVDIVIYDGVNDSVHRDHEESKVSGKLETDGRKSVKFLKICDERQR